MSVVELPDIRLYSHKSRTRSKKSDFEKYRNSAVLKSVDKLIKHNSLCSVLGQDSDYYPKQLEDQKKVDEAQEVHANLTELKKSCDYMKMSGNNKDKDIDKMRKDIDQMSYQIEQYNQRQKELERQENDYSSKLQEQQKLLSQSNYDKKIFEHMLTRMKTDQVNYQLRANQYERHLRQAFLACQSSSQKALEIQVLHQKTMLALKEVADGIKQQNRNREKNISRFKNELKQKQDVEHKRDERIKRQQEIAEVAANDIRDGALKKWRKLLLVHKFLNSFLKSKMQRGIAQYHHLEIAFQKIKASTGISDANEIVQKFIGREQTYSHLLISISDYEKKINNLKQENQDLRNNFTHLKQEYNDLDKEFSVENNKQRNEQTDQDKMVIEVEEKATISGLLQNKLNTWIARNLKKLAQRKDKGFQGIIDAIKEKLLNLSQTQQQELLNKSIFSSVLELNDQEFLKRNVRIKPKQQNSHLHSNNSQDYSVLPNDDEIFNELPSKDEEQEEQEEDNLLNQLREEVKGKVLKK
ncbi:unnamed protein product (macronuclear) [Paramecium tetraurelia]|uniref:Dynein regulatory complex protein 1/2 N-terminal domain-containing protein n=1 Tax=Paramecium tetraurelia TaxID=5888 RepID=A0DSR4_PARTE|nr:uncharacterized protein GSPATT00019774001 [Paramecium tetraurelia]CAK86081.1 unnamed protein product [Paramecium tetraurelia]|eukprot:XP_001453478.1 hypothetical protein (macronuclear) [Paramecium tetraurelia strain d4-2]